MNSPKLETQTRQNFPQQQFLGDERLAGSSTPAVFSGAADTLMPIGNWRKNFNRKHFLKEKRFLY